MKNELEEKNYLTFINVVKDLIGIIGIEKTIIFYNNNKGNYKDE